ncbi:MAG TPA: HAMP domain-containing sensor histidine kinase [Mucilaginibacter sp.]
MKEKLIHTIPWLNLIRKKISVVLLLIIVTASAAMIVMNYYTIKILSSARAYINGESQYSKGQKDASAHLINYIYLEKEADYTSFLQDLSIPRGDRMARLALSSNVNYQEAKKGFLQARNYPEDIDDMIWGFRKFRYLPMFEKAVKVWVDADEMVDKLYQLGLQSRQKVISGKISDSEKKTLIISINGISERLTIKQQAFSNILGAISRKVNLYVFIADLVIILVIVTSSFSYAGIMIRNLTNSKKKIIEQNDKLQLINAGLDKFVFNVTHDLRSPLTSIIGLINMIDEETDPEQIKSYTLMMKNSLEKQDQFINEMLTFIRSKHLGVVKEESSLVSIIDNVITHNHYRNDGKEIHFYKEIGVNEIYSDGLKLRVILNNLISNAVKYSDSKKEEQYVKVKTYLSETDTIIEVEDNGIGIRQKDQERIFDEFYTSGNNKKSSGIGLYLVKDAVTQINGRIEVESEPGLYSKFIVSIPCSN